MPKEEFAQAHPTATEIGSDRRGRCRTMGNRIDGAAANGKRL